MIVGAWVDDAFDSIDTAYATRFRAAGLVQAALMANRMNAQRSAPGWELRGKPATIARAAAHLRDAGVEVSLTCWPRPDREQLAELERAMGPLLDACSAMAVEVDCEANWTPKHLHGFRTMAEASAELVATLRRLADGHRRVELTTYPFHAENTAGALVAPHVDLLLPQAYSVSERAGASVPWGSSLGPGAMQRTTLERTAKTGAPATALVGCGLAAYEQRFAGHAPEDAMRVALDTARSLGITTVRYWSSKWIVGALAKRQPWAERFVRSIGDGALVA